MSDTCDDCGQRIARGKHDVAFNLNPKDGLLHRQSCPTPSKAKNAETEAQVKRQFRL